MIKSVNMLNSLTTIGKISANWIIPAPFNIKNIVPSLTPNPPGAIRIKKPMTSPSNIAAAINIILRPSRLNPILKEIKHPANAQNKAPVI